jgi:hypothetical protein
MSGKRTLHDYFSSGKKQKISDDESPVQDELQQPSTSRTSTIPVECPVITEVKLKSDSDFDSGDDYIANDFPLKPIWMMTMMKNQNQSNLPNGYVVGTSIALPQMQQRMLTLKSHLDQLIFPKVLKMNPNNPN